MIARDAGVEATPAWAPVCCDVVYSFSARRRARGEHGVRGRTLDDDVDEEPACIGKDSARHRWLRFEALS